MDAQIIPADTDYRMFSYDYYGSLPGVDIAFLLDSAAYHTHQDAPHRIRPGTVQVHFYPWTCLMVFCLCQAKWLSCACASSFLHRQIEHSLHAQNNGQVLCGLLLQACW